MSVFKNIDSMTIKGSIFLFIITSLLSIFILLNMKPDIVLKGDQKTVNKFKVISVAIIFSFIFTFIITYISLKVDLQNLPKK